MSIFIPNSFVIQDRPPYIKIEGVASDELLQGFQMQKRIEFILTL